MKTHLFVQLKQKKNTLNQIQNEIRDSNCVEF